MADTSRARQLLERTAALTGGPQAVKLARAVCLAVLVEPGLLRRARIDLVPGADAGTESDLWFSPLVLTRNVTGIVLHPDVLTVLRQQLASEAGDRGLAGRARELVERLHAGHPPAMRLEEAVIWEAVRHADTALAPIDALLRMAVKAMATDPDEGWAIARWAAQAWWRLPDVATRTDAAHLLAVGAALRLGSAASVASLGDQTMPASLGWLAPHRLREAVPLGVELAAYGLRFTEPASGDLVVELPCTSPLVAEISWHDGAISRGEVRTIAPGTHVVLGSIVGPVTLRTLAGRRYVIEPEAVGRPGQPGVTSWRPSRPRVVNPPPATVPPWFVGRQTETGLLAGYLADPVIRMVTVAGPAGTGKTAMVCRLLKGLEEGRIPDVEGDLATIAVNGIVYLSPAGAHRVEYATLVADLLRLLPADAAQRLQLMYRDPQHRPLELIRAALLALPAEEPVVVLLDGLESVMDRRSTITDQALDEALAAVLTTSAHPVTVIITTRARPFDLLRAESARQRVLILDQGLAIPAARTVLRELDNDGRLGLRDAPDELLDELARRTRGFPRALEAVKAILESDPALTPRDLLERIRSWPERHVIEGLVEEAYNLLDPPARQAMQALAVYPAPVPADAVDFLLRPFDPTTDFAPVLTRLVGRRLVDFDDGRYYLHPVDRDQARGQIPADGGDDSRAAFTLAGLQARAADYYAQIRTPPQSWRSLDDLQPQLAEFGLRCDVGDYDSAAAVLADIDPGCLQVWGHYRISLDLHQRIRGRVTDPALNAAHLQNLALCQWRLGDYRQAIDLHTEVLAIARDLGDRGLEYAELGNLGLCWSSLGDYQQATNLHTQALAIARELGDRRGEGILIGNLGLCWSSLGDYRRARDLLGQALLIARDLGDRQGEGILLGNLGRCWSSLGDYGQAINLHTQALAIARDLGYRRGEVIHLGNLGLCWSSLGDYQQARDLHTQALSIARDLGDRRGESFRMSNLALCYCNLGDVRQAMDLGTRALSIARDLGDRHAEATALEPLGRARLAAGDPGQAVELFEQAVTIADATGNVEPAALARSGLALARLVSGDPAAALAATVSRPESRYPTEEPTRRLLQGIALLELDRADQARQAFGEALVAADELGGLADKNVAALQARALALSGFAAATGDPAVSAEAVRAFAKFRPVTTAAGVVADTSLLLSAIASCDRSGVLADVRDIT